MKMGLEYAWKNQNLRFSKLLLSEIYWQASSLDEWYLALPNIGSLVKFDRRWFPTPHLNWFWRIYPSFLLRNTRWWGSNDAQYIVHLQNWRYVGVWEFGEFIFRCWVGGCWRRSCLWVLSLLWQNIGFCCYRGCPCRRDCWNRCLSNFWGRNCICRFFFCPWAAAVVGIDDVVAVLRCCSLKYRRNS